MTFAQVIPEGALVVKSLRRSRSPLSGSESTRSVGVRGALLSHAVGAHGRAVKAGVQAARRGSLDGPVTVVSTMD